MMIIIMMMIIIIVIIIILLVVHLLSFLYLHQLIFIFPLFQIH